MARRKDGLKRVLVVVASLALVVGLVPAFSFADEDGESAPEPSPAVEESADVASGASVAEGDGAGAPSPVQEGAPSPDAVGGGSAVGVNANNGPELADGDAQAVPAEGTEGPAEGIEAVPEGVGVEDGSGTGPEDADEAIFPAFKQSQTVGGVTVTVEADEGAFPEGAILSVASVPSAATEDAVVAERDAGQNVAASYTFDVKVLGRGGEELQPADGRSVRVSFAADEVADPNLETSVYHVSGGTAEELAVSESGATATATSDGFSFYTVEFTYGDLQYVLPGGESIPLADVLAVVGLEGEPEAVEVSDPALFSASAEADGWTVTSHEAFSSEEWMRVTIAGTPYEIAVTDSEYTQDGLTFEYDDSSATATVKGFDNKSHDVEIPPVITVDGKTYVVTGIGKSAFEDCDKLSEVGIPDTVTSIEEMAFLDCINLSSVEIPRNVMKIEDSTFAGCTSLESVEIHKKVTSIGEMAFIDCESLQSIEISDMVSFIGNNAFFGCSELDSITICRSQEFDLELGWGAFQAAKTSEATFKWTGSQHLKDMVTFGVTPDDAGYRIKGKTLKMDDNLLPATITVKIEDGERSATPTTATLTFDLGGGTLDGKTGTITVEANVGDVINLPKAPTRDGYTFKFWKGSEYEAGAEYTVEGDHEFTAEWAKTHKVTFDANGHGTAPAAQEVEDGKTAKKPADPKASGWTFGGWYTDKACTQVYDFSKPVTSDITLYAKWTEAKSSASRSSTARTGDDNMAFVVTLSVLAAVSLCTAALGARKMRARAHTGSRARR